VGRNGPPAGVRARCRGGHRSALPGKPRSVTAAGTVAQRPSGTAAGRQIRRHALREAMWAPDRRLGLGWARTVRRQRPERLADQGPHRRRPALAGPRRRLRPRNAAGRGRRSRIRRRRPRRGRVHRRVRRARRFLRERAQQSALATAWRAALVLDGRACRSAASRSRRRRRWSFLRCRSFSFFAWTLSASTWSALQFSLPRMVSP
jgi:hypothetical protein